MSGFIKASKQMAKAKIAMIGPSGSGKTFSALRMARGLTQNGRVGVVDSENNSASLYSDKFDGWEYMVLPVSPPYTARKYLDAIALAVRENLDCLIIDSLTHVWAGEGGLLQQKEAMDSRAGSNSFANWQHITKVHEALKSQILYSPIHLIATMRSKQEYVLETNDRGKSVPKKVGLKPIQRDDLEYEFTCVFDIGMDHQYVVSKDRTDLFDGMVSKVTEQTGADIRGWLVTRVPPPPAQDEAVPEQIKQQIAQSVAIPESSRTGGPTTAMATQAPRSEPMSAEDMDGPPPQAPWGGRVDMRPDPVLTPQEFAALKNSPGTMGVTKIVDAQMAKEREQARQIKNHATGDMQPAPARMAPPSSPAREDSAEYVIKCGQNWGMVGKRMIDINESTLKAALSQAQGMVAKGNANQDVKDFVRHCIKFLTEVGVAI